jgi:uncharacterized phage protein (TIGR01671 family)
MNREIKFRAWLPREKKFVEYLLGVEYYESEFEDAIFQQYTGIKDKNGKEIYEGDLILGSYGRDIRLVHFNNENYGEIWGWNNLEWGTIEDGKIVECKKDHEFANMDLTYYEPQLYYYGNSPCKTDVVIGNIIEGVSNEFSKIVH